MSEKLKVSSAKQVVKTRRTLSVGVGDGRENGLRESTRALRARKVKRSVMRNASTQDVAAFERVWEDVKRTMVTPAQRTDRMAAARELMRARALESSEALDVCADAILGQREEGDDPELQK